MPGVDAPVTRRLRTWIAPAADLAVVVIFVAIGRRSHNEANDASGFTTLWPFVVGLAAGALVTRLYVAPLEWRRAVPAWLVTVAVGLALRIGVVGHEFKLSFAIVATTFLGLFLLGWRAIARRVLRRVGS
jgi:hypothetical protein